MYTIVTTLSFSSSRYYNNSIRHDYGYHAKSSSSSSNNNNINPHKVSSFVSTKPKTSSRQSWLSFVPPQQQKGCWCDDCPHSHDGGIGKISISTRIANSIGRRSSSSSSIPSSSDNNPNHILNPTNNNTDNLTTNYKFTNHNNNASSSEI